MELSGPGVLDNFLMPLMVGGLDMANKSDHLEKNIRYYSIKLKKNYPHFSFY